MFGYIEPIPLTTMVTSFSLKNPGFGGKLRDRWTTRTTAYADEANNSNTLKARS